MSIHINAKIGAIAENILLPGDPMRAKFIAETFFEESECFNTVRGMLGFTGLYKGERTSVMGTGMGQPSLSIYVNELIRSYGVKKLIRVGTCGSIQENIKIRDIILPLSASTDSASNNIRFKGMDYAPCADFSLLSKAVESAKAKKLPYHTGSILSSDTFYTDDPDQWRLWAKFGVLGIEMESAELYTLAAKYKVQALSVLTVSDSLVTKEETSSEERERTFKDMIEIALSSFSA